VLAGSSMTETEVHEPNVENIEQTKSNIPSTSQSKF